MPAAAVKATVNGTQITDVQLAQRLKLFGLEGRSGSKAALQELIDEQLMLQEAKRLNIEISEKQVDDAFLNVARNIKVSSDKLREILTQNGVSVDTLRERLRAALAWNQITQNVIMARVQISDVELEQKAEAKLDPSMSYDYILKEVLFVAPGGKGASGRTAQANRYKQSFGCDSAGARRATPTRGDEIGRRHATQRPGHRQGVNSSSAARKPRVVENGVSMLAVCSKSVAETPPHQEQLARRGRQCAAQGRQDKYLADLRKKGRIIGDRTDARLYESIQALDIAARKARRISRFAGMFRRR